VLLSLVCFGVTVILASVPYGKVSMGLLAEFFEVSCYGTLGGRIELLIIN
jgi:hypothetical protein